MNLEELKLELKNKPISDVLNKHILAGEPVCFGRNLDLVIKLKKSISNHFDVHLKNIEVVGSSKLGISLSEEKLGKPYSRKSDIDIVIVSSELFDAAWHALLKLDFKFHTLNEKDRQFLKDCYDSTHRGYISPDRLPINLGFRNQWWGIFYKLSNREEYEYRKIRGRLFKNWWFVEKYYSIQLLKLKKLLEGE
ncbi:MAG: hypothetical protein NT096_07255 [Proteobacteria bacterium]|nr:hypothetical protein [Pseudomonadota bacterium]